MLRLAKEPEEITQVGHETLGVAPPDEAIGLLPPTELTPPPPTGGATHVASSRKKRALPDVAPGSGAMPAACAVPEAPNAGRSPGVSALNVGAAAAPLAGPENTTLAP